MDNKSTLSGKTHNLKTLPPFFKAVKDGAKTFEIRKNDRNFQFGDTLVLKEYDEKYTGKEIKARVIYILNGGQFGLDKDYVIMSLKVGFFDELSDKEFKEMLMSLDVKPIKREKI